MKPLIVLNWKNHPASWKEAKELFKATQKAVDKSRSLTLIVAPPTIYLREIAAGYKGKRIAFAAQGVHWDEEGGHTGEMTVAQAYDAGVSHVLIGHAERRARGETPDDTRRLLTAALQHDLIPILCVGELERSHEGEHFAFIREQLRIAFSDVSPTKMAKVIIAYEPVWAIGAEEPMSPREMHEMSIFIRKTIHDLYGKVGLSLHVLYGGAIDHRSAGQMLGLGDVQGLLVGRASADSEKVLSLLISLQRVK